MVDFHLLLADASGNRLYKYFLRSLIAISYDYIHKFAPAMPPLNNHVEQHRAILEAVKAGNLDEALKALRHHLLSHSEHIENAMRTG
jgi:DNA-binding GntR family transcriptional regulator